MNKLAVFFAIALVSCTPRGGIPDLHSSALCSAPASPRPPLAASAWLASADLVGTGVISGMRFDYERPLQRTGEEWRVAEDCEVANPVFIVDVGSIVKIGGQADDVPSTMSLFFGVAALDMWIPRPIPTESGAIDFWNPQDSPNKLVVGQSLGFVAHRYGDVWTTSGEPFFLRDEDDTLTWSEVETECGSGVPKEPPATLGELKSALVGDADDDDVLRATERAARLEFPVGEPCCAATCVY